jgi:ABC-type Fe3+ transport system permease subunit
VGLSWHLQRKLPRQILGVCAAATLALPAFLVAGVWMEWVGFAGAWREGSGVWLDRVLPVLYSSLVLGTLLWPVTAFFFASGWNRADARLVESMPELRGWDYGRHILLPQAGTAWMAPAAITLALAFANFTVPALFQARVWPAEVWIEYSTRFDLPTALGKSLIPVVMMLALIGLAIRTSPRWTAVARSTAGEVARDRVGRRNLAVVSLLALAVVLLTLVLPVAATLATARTWDELGPAAKASMPTLQRSVVYAAVASTVACLAGFAVSGRRWGIITVIPFVLPGVFAGLLLAQSTTWPGGSLWQGTAAPVFAALGLRYAFVGWLAGERLWRSANPRLLEGMKLDGANRWTLWRHLLLPDSGRTLAAAWLVVYVLALWDVETLILVVPPGGDTLALLIFNLLHYGHNAQVGALCVLLGGLAVLPLIVVSIAGWWRARAFSASGGALVVGLFGLAALLGAGCQPKAESNSLKLESRLFERVEVIGGQGHRSRLFRQTAIGGRRWSGQRCIVVDMTGRVQRFDSEGQWVERCGRCRTPSRGKAKGMCKAPGTVGLCGWSSLTTIGSTIARSAGKALLGQWGIHGTNAGQLWFPRAVAAGGFRRLSRQRVRRGGT